MDGRWAAGAAGAAGCLPEAAMTAALIGALIGAGVWLVGRGLVYKPVPLQKALSDFHGQKVPRQVISEEIQPTWRRSLERRALRAVEALGFDLGTLSKDLRIVKRSSSEHAFSKLASALLLGGGIALLVGVLNALGVNLPVWSFGIFPLLGLAAGYMLADGRLRKKAEARREEFLRSLSAYLGLVKILLAGGSHSEGALQKAAMVGSGWAFDELKAAMEWSQVNGLPPSAGFERLAEEIDVGDVEELAATIRLASEQGASPAESLARKAETLNLLELASARMRADATTEKMSIPTVVVAIAFVMFVGYPALGSLLEAF